MEYCNNNNILTIVCDGTNYGDKNMKHFQGLVQRTSEIKQLNISVLIEDNTSSDLVEKW